MEPNDIDISSVQRRILAVVVEDHEPDGPPVGSARIADRLDRSPGTIKNQMKQLTTLGLADSVRGPGGGYRPNENTYAVLDKERFDEEATVNLARDYQRVDVTVSEIDLTNVAHPTECSAHVHFQEGGTGIEVGDPIAAGPTPVADLVIAGEVTATFSTGDHVLLDVTAMEAPLPGP